jgi:hypothetical protein
MRENGNGSCERRTHPLQGIALALSCWTPTPDDEHQRPPVAQVVSNVPHFATSP